MIDISLNTIIFLIKRESMSKAPFDTYREHTAVKHAILRDYLNAFVPILGSWQKRIIYIDGFCGPGCYKCDGQIFDGSPIIALRIAQEFSDRVELVCLFIDIDKEFCEELQQRINDLGLEGNYKIIPAKFEEVIKDLLNNVERMAPAFCFIDPFGYSGLPLQLIRRFLERARTEALVNFMYEPISRFLPVKSQHQHMDALFGTNKWRAVLEKNLRLEERESFLRELYHEQLKTCAKYVWPFQLKDPDRGRTMYYLFHCANHPKGIKVMKEVMYRKGTRGTYSYQGREFSQMALFSTEPNINELEHALLREFAGKTISFEDIINSTLEWPFIEKHYREVLNDLKAKGSVKKKPVDTKGDRGLRGRDQVIFQ
jgi:three-Cys-motif partner protein